MSGSRPHARLALLLLVVVLLIPLVGVNVSFVPPEGQSQSAQQQISASTMGRWAANGATAGVVISSSIPSAYATGTLPGWSYRKSHLILPTPGAGTGYQIKIMAHKSSGTDSGQDVYLGSNVRDDFGDVRFTASDGTSLLAYWIESYTSGSVATFWVKIADDLSANPVMIYVYYGNSAVTTTSKGIATFSFFDDFTGASINSTLWTIVDSTGWSVASSELKGTSTTGRIQSIPTFSSGVEMRVKYRYVSLPTDGYMVGGFRASTSVGFGYLGYTTTSYYWANGTFYVMSATSPASTNLLFTTSSRTSGTISVSDTNFGTGAAYQSASYQHFTNMEPIVLGKRYDDCSTCNGEAYQTYWDWIAVRKYVYPEPQHGAWGQAILGFTTAGTPTPSFTYRKSHTITGSGAAGTGYQVRIIAHAGSGTDSGQDVYLNSHARYDFGDIRFRDSNGNDLSYWMDSVTYGSQATFWIKVNDDLSTGKTSTIYIYYGDVSSATASSFSGTMITFTANPSFTATGDCAGYPSYSCYPPKTNTQTNPQNTRYADGMYGYIYTGDAWSGWSEEGYWIFDFSSSASRSFYVAWYQSAAIIAGYPMYFTSSIRSSPDGSAWTTQASSTLTTATTTSLFLTNFNVAGRYLMVDAYSPDSQMVSGYTYVDAVYARTYVSPEPAQGGWGSEEVGSGRIQLTLDGGGVGSVPPTYYKGYATGASATASVPATTTISGNTYTFIDWEYANGTVISTSNSITVSNIQSSDTCVARYAFGSIIQITVTSNPGTGSGFLKVDGLSITTPQTYSWLSSSSHTLEALSPVTGTGYQYTYSSWSDGGSQAHSYTVPGSSQTVTANYNAQYQLTVNSAYDTPTGSGWYTAGASATASVTSPVSGGSGVQYVCTGFTGTGSAPSTGSSCSVTFAVNAQSSVTFGWVTQYQVAFTSSSIGSDSSGTVVTVNGNAKMQSQLSYTAWYNSSSPINYAFSSPISAGIGKRYSWVSTSGIGQTAQSGSFTVSAAGTVTGNYKTQYLLIMAADPSGGGTTTPAAGQSWYDSGSTVSLSETANIGYVFGSWMCGGTGCFSGSNPSGSATMNNAVNETASFTTPIQVTITSDPAGSGHVLVDGAMITTPQTYTWAIGATHNVTAVDTLSCATTCIQVWSSWSDAGARSHLITVPSSSPVTYTATFTSKYSLATFGTGIAQPANVTWMDDGTPQGAVISSPFSYASYLKFSGTQSWILSGTALAGDNFDSSSLGSWWTQSPGSSVWSGGVTSSGHLNPNSWYAHFHGVDWQISPNSYERLSASILASSSNITVTWWTQTNNFWAWDVREQAYLNGVICYDTVYDAGGSWKTATCSGTGLVAGNSYAFYIQGIAPSSYYDYNANANLWIDEVSVSGGILSGTPVKSSFYNSPQTISVTSYPYLYVRVYLNATSSPDEIMLELYDGSSWNHRVFWGNNQVGLGTWYTASRMPYGPLPPAGRWVTLQVKLSDLGLTSGTITGMSFMTSSWQPNAPYTAYFDQVTASNLPLLSGQGWYAAGSQATIIATSMPDYSFTGWTGTGDSSYSGPSSSSSVTLNGAITEFASYASTTQMTVQYQIVGGGANYSAPAMSYILGGQNRTYTLTNNPTPVSADLGTVWVISPSTLAGSSASERWLTLNVLNGTASPSNITITYQHQFALTTQASPIGGGTVTPSSGWRNANSTLSVSTTVNQGYAFLSWIGNGTGSYTGTNNPASVTLQGAVTEIANFTQSVQITLSSNPAGSGYVIVDGTPTTTPQAYSWTIGSSHNVTATPDPAPCGVGCQLVWQSWSDSGGRSHLITVPSASVTYTAAFKTQYQLTMVANPSSGGSTTPTVGSYWYDSGSVVSVNASPSSMYSFASWNDGGARSHSVTMNQARTLTANFVSVDVMTVSYRIIDGGEPSAPIFTCIQLGASHQFILGGNNTQVSCDTGTEWTVTPNPLTGSTATERWRSSQALNGTVTTQTLLFSFYHQYRLALAYSVSGGSSYSAPTFTAARYGSSAPETLSAPANYWYDAGSSWSVVNPLTGSNSNERWYTLQASSGTIDSTISIVFNYAHQFLLTMGVSPSGGGTVTPASSWQNETASAQISTTASLGYAFVSWSGSGDTCYSGTNNPAFVEIKGPITETANFIRPVDHFVFSTISSPQTAGMPFSIAITAVDASGDTVTSYTGTNTLSASTGSISPTSTGAFSGGVWTGSVTLTTAGTGLTIGTSGGGKSGTSNSFTVNSGALYRFVFSTISSPQTVGAAFNITITALDVHDNTSINYTGTNTLNASAGSISPTSTGSFSSGVWTGSVTLTSPGSSISITTNGGGKSGTSNSFTVNVGTLDHFAFSTISSPRTAGVAFPITITAVDAGGNTVTTYIVSNTLNDTTGTINPTSTDPFVNGVWTGNVIITKAQSSVTITTGGGGDKAGTSNSFNISPASLDHFAFNTVTSPQVVGAVFPITITAIDAAGNTITNYTGTNTLSASTGSISPTSTGAFSGGVWTGSVTLTTAGTGLTIGTSGGGRSGTSNSFAINVGALDHFAFSTITSPKTAGTPFSITITASDQYGNTLTGYTGTNTLSASTGSISPTSTGAFSGGVWTGSVTLTTAGTGLTIGTSGGGKSGTSNSFTVNVATVTMRVSYQVAGGGTGYAPPVFSYLVGGVDSQYELTTSPTDVQVDAGSAWSVALNPLDGSSTSERWYSIQTLSGAAAAQTILFTFQHQYYLTMVVGTPGGGYTAPTSGWQDAGAAVPMSATPSNGYVFSAWTCSGSGCYSGTDNPATIPSMGSAMTETASFSPQTTMTVSYAISGGELGYAAPIFHYVQNGASMTYELTGTAAGIQCDLGSSWSVSSNPLTGSTGTERWYSSQSLSGTVSGQTLVFTFQHQYMLTMDVNPTGVGSTLPVSSWENSGASVGISATATGSSHSFLNWTGTGTGSYSGANNPVNITMNATLTETANFVGQVTMAVSYAIMGGGTGYSAPVFVYAQGGQNKTLTLTGAPTAVVADAGSAWGVTPSPLSGSSMYERWYSNQALTGSASTQNLIVVFYHQYYLTTQGIPSGGGSISPNSGWQDAGASVTISASAAQGYVFSSWTGTGSGSYTGPNSTARVLMSDQTTEAANFNTGSQMPVQVTVTVSYQIVGSGFPSAPVFNYIQNRTSRVYNLTSASHGVQCDAGSTWSVMPNPLSGSSSAERWQSSQPLTGTATTQTLAFSFQHQYYLTVLIDPTVAGTVTPASGWQNAGTTVNMRATQRSGYTFQSWIGSGSGSYTGTNNPAAVTVNGAVTETAGFVASTSTAGSQCTLVTSQAVEKGSVFSAPQEQLSPQQLLLPLSIVLPTSGLVANRRARRSMRNNALYGRRGSLSTLASLIIVIIMVAVAAGAVAGYYYYVGAGAARQQGLIFSDSAITVDPSKGTGTVYIKMYNGGPGAVQIRSINVTSDSGDFSIDFSSGRQGVVNVAGVDCAISGQPGVGVNGSNGKGFFHLPTGKTVSILITFSAGMNFYFVPGTQYQAIVVPMQAADMPFSIPSRGGQ